MTETIDPIRLLLVDDQQLLRQGLRMLLEMEPGLQVAGEASDGQEALEAYSRLQPDVVLMDIRMPVLDGVEATRMMRQRWPSSKIIILTTFDDDVYVFEGLRAGALGYLLKDVSIQELTQAIRTVNSGGALIEPSITRKVLAEFARLAPGARVGTIDNLSDGAIEELSERELEVLRLVARGLTNRQIAEQLYLAEGTVKNYISAIFQKLGVQDRLQAVLAAQQHGLI
ncbi:MAG: response regulator transcription factor [Anaerolineales bacterium]|nr:response regulator transcription factor [Anaerolineales bacterium]